MADPNYSTQLNVLISSSVTSHAGSVLVLIQFKKKLQASMKEFGFLLHYSK